MKYLLAALLLCLSSCTQRTNCDNCCVQTTELTTGLVQREISLGMPASDVAAILGSPNIVSLDEQRDEVWIYDKVSSSVEYSSQGGGVWLLIAGASSESGYRRNNQKTLTIIIKFDKDKRVKDFNYHSSSF